MIYEMRLTGLEVEGSELGRLPIDETDNLCRVCRIYKDIARVEIAMPDMCRTQVTISGQKVFEELEVSPKGSAFIFAIRLV